MADKEIRKITVSEDDDGKAVWEFEGKVQSDIPLDTDAQNFAEAINELKKLSEQGEGEGFIDDGSNGEVVRYVPKFYSKFVPMTYKNIPEYGFSLKDGNFFVSSEPKGDLTLHSAFYNLNGNEISYILMSLDGKIYDSEFKKLLESQEDVVTYYILRGNAIVVKKCCYPYEEISQGTYYSFEELPSPDDADEAKRPRLGYIYYTCIANDDGTFTDYKRYFWNWKKYERWY